MILDYMAIGPYICLLLSFGLSLGGLIVGSAVIFVMSSCEAGFFRKVRMDILCCYPSLLTINIVQTMMRTRSRVYCTLFLIAYPYIAVGVSTAVCAMGEYRERP
jgi:hypothetical protein